MDSDDLPDIRRALLRGLYLRRAAALTAAYLATATARRTGLPVTMEIIQTELAYLHGKGWTASNPDPLGGSATYHTLTPEGINFCEANDLTD